jgi:mannitol-1-/sugar-/sorbitol-6-/2-deoxyglucose-6-phosphatase
MQHIQAVIFDMDGLLIDSEPLWRVAEVEVFKQVGLQLDETMCHQTTGLSTKEVVRYWHSRRPWPSLDVEGMVQALEDKVIALVKERGRPLPGVYELLNHCQTMGFALVVASGSAVRLIEAVLDKLALSQYFSCYHSAELERAGKPDPAVYLTALRRLGLKANQAIALEDSVRGIQAAKAAGLYTIAVPDAGADRAAFSLADEVVDSLHHILDRAYLNPSLEDAIPLTATE